MNYEEVIGELLYIGFAAEKGRCYGRIWGVKYKKVLKKHIFILRQLLHSLYKDPQNINVVIIEFIDICNKFNEIGKFYNINQDLIYQIKNDAVCWVKGAIEYTEINKLMFSLVEDLWKNLNKFFIDKKEVYNILNVLHNIPRIYLQNKRQTLCNLNLKGISIEDAIEYVENNMNEKMRARYKKDVEKILSSNNLAVD